MQIGPASGAEAGGFDQANLISAGREFTTLVALHNHTATGFHPDDPRPNPAKGG